MVAKFNIKKTRVDHLIIDPTNFVSSHVLFLK